jgi:hypothetical protein
VTPHRFPTRKLLAFAALGGLDFALTWYLFRAGGGAVREVNPVAAWCLGSFGWRGLAGFKAATMGLAAGLGVLVFLRRPTAGHRVLGFGCAALAAVVLYSAYLSHDLRHASDGAIPSDEAIAAESDRLDAGLERARDHHRVLDEMGEDVRAGRRTLEQAAARLAATGQACDLQWLATFRLYYPDCTDVECHAISLMNHLAPTDSDGSLGERLRAEYQAAYGRPAPAGLARGTIAVASAPGGDDHSRSQSVSTPGSLLNGSLAARTADTSRLNSPMAAAARTRRGATWDSKSAMSPKSRNRPGRRVAALMGRPSAANRPR